MVAVPGPNGATCSPGAGVYGPLSTPWTLTIPVLAGQVVDLSVEAAIKASSDVMMYLAIRRGSTTIYENTHYTLNPVAISNAKAHFWHDATPGVGDITYQIYLAPNSDITLTLLNGATLDTASEILQGKSMFRAEAYAA